ncbi:MAG: hypothetical protein WEE53_09465 [Acidimicrobiia bacterium]
MSFEVARAVADGEAWWSAVITGDIEGAEAIAHPEGQFNFDGLDESAARLGEPVTITVGSDVFGSEQQPLLCFMLRGSDAELTGALVYRQSGPRWLLWEVRPETERCLDGSPVFSPPLQTANGMTEFPLTFLDGMQMTLSYSADLDLTSRGLEAQAVGRLSGGVSRVFGIRYGPPEAFVTETEGNMGPGDLATTFPGGEGSVVELWEFPREPIAYLVFDFDPWTAYVWDGMGGVNPRMSDEARASWAVNLHGVTNDQGFLILTAEPPLGLVDAADDPGPDGPDLRIDGSSGSLLVFVNDCDRMTTLEEETYGAPVFAFCDTPTNTLFFVGGDAATQQLIHETLQVQLGP